MEEINVEQIMEEIRAEIKEKGYKSSDLSFQEISVKDESVIEAQYDAQQLRETLQNANLYTRVDYYKPISGNGVKAFIKKLIRKLMKPLLWPICQEQEQYNVSTVRTLNQMYQYMLLQEKKINELEAVIAKKEK